MLECFHKYKCLSKKVYSCVRRKRLRIFFLFLSLQARRFFATIVAMATKSKGMFADAALLLAAVIWGVSFVVMKNTIDIIPPNYLVGIRFSVGAIGLYPFLRRKIRDVNRRGLLSGMVLGLLMYSSFTVQSIGLMYTTAGKNAFITAVYVVLVPFCSWAFTRKRPSGQTVAAAGLCFAGIGVLSLSGSQGINIGDVLTFVSGILFALHIVFVEKYTREGQDVMLLTLLQFAVAGVIGLGAGVLTERFPASIPSSTIWGMGYICLFSTLLALSLQNIGIKYAKGAHASLLLGCESLFGCISGILFLHEEFSLRVVIGGLMIFGALVLSELGKKEL